jgi:hypothetical protein
MPWAETLISKTNRNSLLEILRVCRYGRECGNNTERERKEDLIGSR